MLKARLGGESYAVFSDLTAKSEIGQGWRRDQQKQVMRGPVIM